MVRPAVAFLLLVFLAAPVAGEAQPAGRVYRVGYLSPIRPPGGPAFAGFKRTLPERGWIEGQNVVFEGRFAEGRFEPAAPARRRARQAEYGLRQFVEAGGLMAYGPSLSDMFRKCALYVDYPRGYLAAERAAWE